MLPTPEVDLKTRLMELLPSQCEVKYYVHSTDRVEEIIMDNDALRQFLRTILSTVAHERDCDPTLVKERQQFVEEGQIEHYTFNATYAYAIWFVQALDEEELVQNGMALYWTIQSTVGHYLSNFRPWGIRLVKGFVSEFILTEPRTLRDLPVVIDVDRQRVVIWTLRRSETVEWATHAGQDLEQT